MLQKLTKVNSKNSEIEVRILRISKGRDGVESYKGFLCQEIIKRLELSEKDGLLFATPDGSLFPSVLTKWANGFARAFTIPRKIGIKLLRRSKDKILKLRLISKAQIRTKIENPDEGINNNIDLQEILPSKTIHGSPIYLFNLNNKKSLIWVYSQGGAQPYILPSIIPIENNQFNFLEFFGVFFCEGVKARKGGKHHLERLSFSNNDFNQIKWFLDAIKNLFQIKKSKWRVQILQPNKIDIELEKYLKEYWSRTGLLKENITIYHNQRIKAKHGVCILYISGVSIGETFYELLEYSKRFALRSKDNALNFFRGISRGDIGIMHRSTGGKLEGINFSAETKEDLDFFCKLCKIIGIKTGKPFYTIGKRGYWAIAINGFPNLRKIIELNAVTHQKRKYQLLEGFLKNIKSSTIFKYLKAISKGMNTSSKAAKYLNLSVVTTRALFKKFRNEGYLKGNIDPNDKFHTIVHELSEKGQRELEFYENIEKELEVLKGVINDD